MELEKWLESYDIRKMVMYDLKRYLKEYSAFYGLDGEFEDDYLLKV